MERKIGRYLLYDSIAAGGMATIHFGRLQSQAGFAKTVAIKRLHQHYARDPEFVAMFMDEARIAARIQHPNVVTTLDAVAIDSELFLVMEYVEGESLARLWKTESSAGRRIPAEVASGIVIGVLRGLHAAHEAVDEAGEPLGIIHRDVSPHNILVGRDGVARVLDFGVAKVAGQLGSTRKGQVKGKLNYMAPEQASGPDLDRRADIYAAGVVLWEALSGRRMRDGADDNAIYAQLVSGEVRTLSEVAGDLPDGLNEVVMRALAKDPDDRFATADAFAEELETVVGSVSPRVIGRWVQRSAAGVLAARAAKKKEIEAKSSGVFLAAAPGGPARMADDATVDEPTAATRSDAPLGALSLRFYPKEPGGRRRLLAGALVAFGFGGLIAVLSLRQGGSSEAHEVPGDPAEMSEPSAPSARGTSAPPPTASTAAGAGSAAPAIPTASATPGEMAAPSARPHGTALPRPTPKPPAPAAPDCDPPYIITEAGVRRYKVECL